ncbi:class I SAM-dependent methyltransferase [Neiella marina]|uniref:Class I SAM-dependent methyltransferase n=2 Tax=Neiella holothuriorum TaxID=2870530 RepID=A0ABS7ECV6_9GAMM|nr:class I SAM-dependent methyltransferase [Neiella holothuriorum]
MTQLALHSGCPLCQHEQCHHYHTDKLRSYYQCQQCQLVFVARNSLPDAKTEKAVYDCHENNVDDLGYRQFLKRVAEPLIARLEPNARGLDFGCGPGPALAMMLTEQGHATATYDPFFAPDHTPLQQQYDFVTCTEAIEHFHNPQYEWQQLLRLIRPGGWLAIMTKLVGTPEQFANWHYKQDPTHVSFFSQATFKFLASRHQLTLEFIGADVMLMQSRASSPTV